MTLGLRRVSCIHKPAQQHGSGCPSGHRDGPAGGQEGRAGESRGSGGRTEAGVGTALCGCSREAGDRQDPCGLQLSGSRRWVQVRGAEGTIAGRGLAVPAPALSPPVPLHEPAEPQPRRQREGQRSPTLARFRREPSRLLPGGGSHAAADGAARPVPLPVCQDARWALEPSSSSSQPRLCQVVAQDQEAPLRG